LPTSRTERRGSPLGWLLALSAVEVATMLPVVNFSAALPLVRSAWTVSAAQAGLIFGGQQIGYAFAVLVLSSLTDRAGVRRIYLASAVLNGIGALAFALWADDFASALAARALIGAGLAGTYVPGMRLVVERTPSARRGAAMGIYIACFSVGAAASLFLTGALLPTGLRTAFAVTAVGPLLAAAAAGPLLGEASRPAPIEAPPVLSVLRNITAMRFILAYAAHNWELFAMRAWMPAFLTAVWQAAGRPLQDAAVLGATVSGVLLIGGAASNTTGGWLSDRLGRSRTIRVFLTASACCSFALGWLLPYGAAVVVAAALLYGTMVTADSSTLSTAVAEAAAPGALGRTLAVQSSLGFVLTAASPAVFGLILDESGAWGWSFASLGAAALAGVLVTPRSSPTPVRDTGPKPLTVQ
jgi:MFS family permease